MNGSRRSVPGTVRYQRVKIPGLRVRDRRQLASSTSPTSAIVISLVAVLVVPRQTSHALLDITCRRLVEKQRRLATSKDRRYATVMADHDLAIAPLLERESAWPRHDPSVALAVCAGYPSNAPESCVEDRPGIAGSITAGTGVAGSSCVCIPPPRSHRCPRSPWAGPILEPGARLADPLRTRTGGRHRPS